jgi:hypothetical protein
MRSTDMTASAVDDSWAHVVQVEGDRRSGPASAPSPRAIIATTTPPSTAVHATTRSRTIRAVCRISWSFDRPDTRHRSGHTLRGGAGDGAGPRGG